jgi:PIN domain nuclease of toxin-antitoxin system
VTLLLDTHALLWWLDGRRLDGAAKSAIADPQRLVLVSAVSIWEAAIKASLGKLTVPGSLREAAEASGFDLLSITAEHAEVAGALPEVHRDPFDRMLVAQAMVEDCTIVSRDPVFGRYAVSTLIC